MLNLKNNDNDALFDEIYKKSDDQNSFQKWRVGKYLLFWTAYSLVENSPTFKYK